MGGFCGEQDIFIIINFTQLSTPSEHLLNLVERILQTGGLDVDEVISTCG